MMTSWTSLRSGAAIRQYGRNGARDGAYLCFVEVKYRKDAAAGDPLEAVGWRKQTVICRVADHFLLTHRQWADLQIRFDVVAILKDEITLLTNAFPYIGL